MKTTKELARELGFLRQRKNPGTNLHSKKRSRAKYQEFSYLIVLDYESTCWEQRKFQTQEIIEFPAVLLNTTTGEVESEFHYYVLPEEQPMLSDFCKQLTGITQEQVDNGIPLRICLRKFSHWLDRLQKEKGLIFGPPSDDLGDAAYTTFVTWSDWDLGTCLLNECKRKQLIKPSQLNNWIDLRATYRKFYSRKPNGLNGALQDLGIEFEGREHSGIVDARNTATLAYRMMCDGCVMKITKTLTRGSKSTSPITVENLLNSKKPLSPTRSPLPKRRRMSDMGKEEEVMMATPDKNSHSFLKPVLRRSPRHLKKTPTHVTSPVRKSPRLLKRSRESMSADSKVKNATQRETPTRHIVSKGFSMKQIYMDGNCRSVESFSVQMKAGSGLSNRNGNMSKASEPNKNSIKDSNKSNTDKSGKICVNSQVSSVEHGGQFKVPSPSFQFSLCQKSALNVTNSTINSSNSILKTPDTSMSSTMKATPPLCKCGRRSKRRMVQSPGPNLGRFFFSCAGVKTTDRNGCGFFQWEPSVQSSGSTSRRQSFVSRYNLSGLSKPFTPVFQQADKFNSSAQQRRSLGVRPSVIKGCIR
ncbi:ERI1 exoribonuclease 2-like [Saccostrea echinata]|uniref:ERI1 exoribonuclease 2-like n=1 Tax=Saccostrea echinata TaxID=191078 RepID=UPI002A81EF7D|nr:ERI1 exoribonuclease 2-like [Saccostrea echinata]